MTASSVRFWTAIPGAILVAVMLYEVFVDLFHPAESGMLSDFIGRTVFAVFRRSKAILPAAGPLTVVLVIGCWTFALALGFAMIYWSEAPSGIRPASENTFGSCLYFSMEALTTLALGEIRPRSGLLRTLVPLESMVGLAVVTASVSWIVLLYPALSRMRCLARRAFIVRDAERRTGIEVRAAGAEPLLDALVIAIIRARVDFIHFPLLYYFYAYDDRGSLPAALTCLSRCADHSAADTSNRRIQFGGAALQIALDELAALVAERFLRSAGHDRRKVFDLYRRDHLVSETADD